MQQYNRKFKRIMLRDGGKCVNCGTTENLTLDHIRPKSKGGKAVDENLQIMCRKCNIEKGSYFVKPKLYLDNHL